MSLTNLQGSWGARGELPAATVRGVWSGNTVAGEGLAAPEEHPSCSEVGSCCVANLQTLFPVDKLWKPSTEETIPAPPHRELSG